MPETPAAIACTLNAEDFRERMAWIANLTRDALRSHQKQGATLILSYAPEAADRIRQMVEKEQHCCAFLAFAVDETPEGIRVTITAPPEAAQAAELLFEQFVTAPPAQEN